LRAHERQREPEPAAASGLALDTQMAAHRLEQSQHDRQTESRAIAELGAGRFDTPERLEDLAEMRALDADARVLDGYACGVALDLEHERDRARVRELDRVRQQVANDLSRAPCIGAHPDLAG